MTENTTGPTFPLPQPLMAPFGTEITPAMIQDVWDTFVKPSQSDDAPPQSAEMRALMGILRAVHAALDAGPASGPAPAITPGARTVTSAPPTIPDDLRASIERNVEAIAQLYATSLTAVWDALEFLASAFTEPAPDRPGQARRRRHGLDAQRSPYGPRP